MESEARVSYLEMVISAKAVEVYVLKGGQGASGEYVCVGRLEGRPAVDHPYKYHYRFGTTDLPDTKVALLQLRLTPHTPGAQEVRACVGCWIDRHGRVRASRQTMPCAFLPLHDPCVAWRARTMHSPHPIPYPLARSNYTPTNAGLRIPLLGDGR